MNVNINTRFEIETVSAAFVMSIMDVPYSQRDLNFWCRNYLFKFRTPCILNVNNTRTKYVRIMKQTAF